MKFLNKTGGFDITKSLDPSAMEDKEKPETADCWCSYRENLEEHQDGDWLEAILDDKPEKVQDILDKATR